MLVIYEILTLFAVHLLHDVLFRLEFLEVEVAFNEPEQVKVVFLH